MTDRADDILTTTGQIATVTITVVCECGDPANYEVECSDDEGFWTAPLEDRYHFCESCECVIDAGLRIRVMAPE